MAFNPDPKIKSINKERICKNCDKSFVSVSHGGKKEFCSYSCANRFNWSVRIANRVPKKPITKICKQCGTTYERNVKFSNQQWINNKFCSLKCFAMTNKIKDGMSNGERSRRKRGAKKMHSPEWLELIKARTKEGMYRPEVQDKIHQPRGPMSEERKMQMSNRLKGIMPKNLNYTNGCGYPNVQRGDYECSKGTHYFRSKWEANYALFLDFLIKTGEIENWEYESDVFMFDKIKLGTRSYRPDFKVFNKDGTIEYHEVKGYMDSCSKTKLKRMGIYFPEIKLILIERKYYMEILKKLKGIVNFY